MLLLALLSAIGAKGGKSAVGAPQNGTEATFVFEIQIEVASVTRVGDAFDASASTTGKTRVSTSTNVETATGGTRARAQAWCLNAVYVRLLC